MSECRLFFLDRDLERAGFRDDDNLELYLLLVLELLCFSADVDAKVPPILVFCHHELAFWHALLHTEFAVYLFHDHDQERDTFHD